MRRYVIIGFDYDPAFELFHDVFNDDDVVFVRNPIKTSSVISSRLLLKLLRCHLIPAFGLSSIFSELLSYDKDEEIVFVYSNPWIEIMVRSGFLDMLKKHYPHAYHAAYLLDIHAARQLDIKKIKSNYDLVAIFGEEEAEKLEIDYIPAPCSKKNCEKIESKKTYDLSFTGKAKNRYPELLRIYKRLSAGGLKCHFYIIGVPEAEQYHAEGLFYGDGLLTPEESLAYIVSSECVLEIQPYKTSVVCSRVQEAIIYDKKVLTNNPFLSKLKYYRPEMMQIYDNVDNIDLDFFKSPVYGYSYEGDYSPRVFLDSVRSHCKM